MEFDCFKMFSHLSILVIVCLYSTATLIVGAEHNETVFFRKDYTFLPEMQSFYKIHTLHRTWSEAKKRCEMEGAKFFYPKNQMEADVVTKYLKKTQPFHWVYIGVSDLLVKGVFISIDGVDINNIFNAWASGEPNDSNGIEDCVIMHREATLNDVPCTLKYPFICKKNLASLEWNYLCDNNDKKYLYNSELNKCYKLHLKRMNWADAYSYCNAEESYLAVINSQKEADFLVEMVDDSPTSKVKPGANIVNGAIHLGFHNKNEDDWETVKGTTLEDSGYSKWADQQSDGENHELCGSMLFNGLLNSVGCDKKCLFICEHDIPLLNSTLNERVGE